MVLAPANGLGRGYGLPVPEGVEEWRVPEPDPVKALLARSLIRGAEPTRPTRTNPLKQLLKGAYRTVLFPDRDILWALRAIRFARKRLKERPDIVALLSSSSGASKHWAAAQLKRWTGLPWVADLHDPWATDSLTERPRSRLRAGLERRLERSLLAQADRIMTVGESYIPRLCTDRPPSEVAIIPGGYDPAHFTDLPAAPPPTEAPFRIAHAGTLYGGQRDPTSLFRAVRRLLERGILLQRQVEILLIGPAEPAVQALAHAEGVAGLVRWTGCVPHRRSLELLAQSHVLALLGTPQGYEVPSKLYEYLAIGRPILALWRPDADVTRIIAAANAGLAVPPDQVEPIAQFITRACRSWQTGHPLPAPDPAYVAGLTRRIATQGLASILDQIH